MKCPVDRVSAMAITGGGAGPRGGFAMILCVTTLLQSLGVPLTYATTGGTAGGPTGGFLPRGGRPGGGASAAVGLVGRVVGSCRVGDDGCC